MGPGTTGRKKFVHTGSGLKLDEWNSSWEGSSLPGRIQSASPCLGPTSLNPKSGCASKGRSADFVGDELDLLDVTPALLLRGDSGEVREQVAESDQVLLGRRDRQPVGQSLLSSAWELGTGSFARDKDVVYLSGEHRNEDLRIKGVFFFQLNNDWDIRLSLLRVCGRFIVSFGGFLPFGTFV